MKITEFFESIDKYLSLFTFINVVRRLLFKVWHETPLNALLQMHRPYSE